MNGTGIIYDQDGQPAVLTIALKLIDNDELKALVNQLLEKLDHSAMEPDELTTTPQWHPPGFEPPRRAAIYRYPNQVWKHLLTISLIRSKIV